MVSPTTLEYTASHPKAHAYPESAQALPASDQDIAPPLLPARILHSDSEALAAAHALAEAASAQVILRDRERKLPWSLVEQFTASGLGSIAIPRAYGGPQLRLPPSPKFSASFPQLIQPSGRYHRTRSA